MLSHNQATSKGSSKILAGEDKYNHFFFSLRPLFLFLVSQTESDLPESSSASSHSDLKTGCLVSVEDILKSKSLTSPLAASQL